MWGSTPIWTLSGENRVPRITYRSIQSGECAALVALHRAVLPAELVARTIYGAPRVVDYLIAFPHVRATGLSGRKGT